MPYYVAPSRERGLKSEAASSRFIAISRSFAGAWIEIGKSEDCKRKMLVAPSRERGLKFGGDAMIHGELMSLLRGSVD